MFDFRIISDGPHRSEKIYLVTDPTLFSSGQLMFGDTKSPATLVQGEFETECLPPLRFVLEDRRAHANV